MVLSTRNYVTLGKEADASRAEGQAPPQAGRRHLDRVDRGAVPRERLVRRPTPIQGTIILGLLATSWTISEMVWKLRRRKVFS